MMDAATAKDIADSLDSILGCLIVLNVGVWFIFFTMWSK